MKNTWAKIRGPQVSISPNLGNEQTGLGVKGSGPADGHLYLRFFAWSKWVGYGRIWPGRWVKTREQPDGPVWFLKQWLLVLDFSLSYLIFVFTNQYKVIFLAKSIFSWKICNIWYVTQLDYQGFDRPVKNRSSLIFKTMGVSVGFHIVSSYFCVYKSVSNIWLWKERKFFSKIKF